MLRFLLKQTAICPRWFFEQGCTLWECFAGWCMHVLKR